MVMANGSPSVVLAAMADGIGDLSFGSDEWIDLARETLVAAAARHADGLAGVRFTLCEVAHNPPRYLHAGAKVAWHATIEGASVTAGSGELNEGGCDFKVEGDHSILSNLTRIQYHGRDPKIVFAARARLSKLSRWKMSGGLPENKALAAILRTLHDTLAVRTLPRFVFMTPEWVSSARAVLSARATSEKYADGIKDDEFTFSEEFTDTPAYAFPDGSHGGFWVNVNHGEITVGAGPLPEQYQPADMQTKGAYTPVVPVGRHVNTALTDAEKEEEAVYKKAAFARDKETGEFPVGQTATKQMSPDLGRVFAVLHDELSKRSSGELPLDFIEGLKPAWATPQSFDRDPGYESWVKYDEFDIYGNPR